MHTVDIGYCDNAGDIEFWAKLSLYPIINFLMKFGCKIGPNVSQVPNSTTISLSDVHARYASCGHFVSELGPSALGWEKSYLIFDICGITTHIVHHMLLTLSYSESQSDCS